MKTQEGLSDIEYALASISQQDFVIDQLRLRLSETFAAQRRYFDSRLDELTNAIRHIDDAVRGANSSPPSTDKE